MNAFDGLFPDIPSAAPAARANAFDNLFPDVKSSPSLGATPTSEIDEGKWQNPGMERIRQLTLGAAHAVAHPIETAGNALEGAMSAVKLPYEVYTGEANLNDPATLDRAFSLGLMINPAARVAGRAKAAVPLAGAPTAENIGALKSAAYANADALGAAYSPEAYKGLIDKIAADAEAKNISSDVHPAASASIRNLQKDVAERTTPPAAVPVAQKSQPPISSAAVPAAPHGPMPVPEGADKEIKTGAAPIPPNGPPPPPPFAPQGTPITLTQLDQKRQMVARDVASSQVPGEKFFGKQIIKNIDDFIANSGPEQMAAGTGPEAAAAIQNARDLNTRFAKNQALEKAVESANLRASSTGSGGNIDNATRQNLRRLLEKGNWTPDEKAILATAVRGGSMQNLLRGVGKLSPKGSGLMAAIELAATAAAGVAGGLPAMAIPAGIAAAGMAAKAGAERITSTNVKKLAQTILAGKGAPVVTRFGKFPRTRAGARALTAAMAANQNTEQGNAFQ